MATDIPHVSRRVGVVDEVEDDRSHSLNGRLLPVAIDAFSSRSAKIWHRSSVPRASSGT